MVRHLAALANLNDATTANTIGTLERTLGVVQHHDAITGTEKQHVADDYSKNLGIGVEKSLDVISESVNSILKRRFSRDSRTRIVYCSLLNITECLPIENQENFNVVLYNPLPRSIQTWLTLPVVSINHHVFDSETERPIVSDTAPVYEQINHVLERKSKANLRLIFRADLPPMGFRVYSVRKNKLLKEGGLLPLRTPLKSNFNIKNERLGLKFDVGGNLISVDNFQSRISVPIRQSFCYYKSKEGSNMNADTQSSGAYVFR